MAMASAAPLEVPQGVEAEEARLQSLAGIPSVARAWCLPSHSGTMELRVQHSQRDLPANKMRYFTSSCFLPESWAPGDAIPPWFWPVENSDAILTSFSPSGQRMLAIKAAKSESDACVFEIWIMGVLVRTATVPKSIHGDVVNDGYFSAGVAWSPDETYIAYSAESPAAVRSKKFGDSGITIEGNSANTKRPAWDGVGPWEEDWGELNVGKRPPRIFVLQADNLKVTCVEGIPSNMTCGQPVWDPSGKSIVFVGWPHQAENFPQSAIRLGAVYCYNRPCHLWQINPFDDFEAHCAMLSAHSPRFSPDGSFIVFLSWGQATNTGVHNSTVSLFRMDWPQVSAPKEIVPVVWSSDSAASFPGLYSGFGGTLIDSPFLDGDTLLLSSQWRSIMSIVAVSLSSGAVRCLTPRGGLRPSFSLMGMHRCLLLASASGPTARPQVMIARYTEGKSDLEWQAAPFQPPGNEIAQSLLDGIEHYILQVAPSKPGSTDLPFEAVVVRERDAPPGPSILMPHGGPHHAFTASYVMSVAFLAACGYTVILVNFRGSTGFGEDSIQSLPGNIGSQDVSDCMDALSAAIEAGFVDPSRVAVCGGSHGGFLTGHLVGQHPSTFRAGILRNPVMDLGLMVYCSDIPDWTYVEAWGTKEGRARFKPRPDDADLQRLYEVSPIRYIDAVRAPLLFMLGAKDHRVTWNDARRYVATMKSRPDPVEVAVWVFPEDTHALDRPQTEFEQWINSIAWLKRHLS